MTASYPAGWVLAGSRGNRRDPALIIRGLLVVAVLLIEHARWNEWVGFFSI
jgi:hypothetical protein